MPPNDDKIEFVESSGNVFADLGLDDADDLNAKAQLAQVIRERIRARGLTQVQAAALLATDQSRISEIMNGKTASFTYDRLLRFLNALECDVEIRVTERTDSDRQGRTLVAPTRG
jgi:predicted XRE-type DNA-binding protein